MKKLIGLLLVNVWIVSIAVAVAQPSQGLIELQTVAQKETAVLDADGTEKVEWVEPGRVIPGDIIGYSIYATNVGQENVEAVVINDPIPAHTTFVADSAAGKDMDITYSVDGQRFGKPAELTVVDTNGHARPALPSEYRYIRWTATSDLQPGERAQAFFKTKVD